MQSLTTDFKRSKAYPRRQEHWIVVSNPSRQMDTNYIFFVLRFSVLFAKKRHVLAVHRIVTKHITRYHKPEYRNI